MKKRVVLLIPGCFLQPYPLIGLRIKEAYAALGFTGRAPTKRQLELRAMPWNFTSGKEDVKARILLEQIELHAEFPDEILLYANPFGLSEVQVATRTFESLGRLLRKQGSAVKLRVISDTLAVQT